MFFIVDLIVSLVLFVLGLGALLLGLTAPTLPMVVMLTVATYGIGSSIYVLSRA